MVLDNPGASQFDEIKCKTFLAHIHYIIIYTTYTVYKVDGPCMNKSAYYNK